MKPGCRLVATDLDGTLLRPDGSIAERTQQAVTTLRTAGLTHVLASGRPLWSLRIVAQRLGASGLAICCNGAIVHHAPLPAEAADNAWPGLRQRHHGGRRAGAARPGLHAGRPQCQREQRRGHPSL